MPVACIPARGWAAGRIPGCRASGTSPAMPACCAAVFAAPPPRRLPQRSHPGGRVWRRPCAPGRGRRVCRPHTPAGSGARTWRPAPWYLAGWQGACPPARPSRGGRFRRRPRLPYPSRSRQAGIPRPGLPAPGRPAAVRRYNQRGWPPRTALGCPSRPWHPISPGPVMEVLWVPVSHYKAS